MIGFLKNFTVTQEYLRLIEIIPRGLMDPIYLSNYFDFQTKTLLNHFKIGQNENLIQREIVAIED
jgi:hypothetical protein